MIASLMKNFIRTFVFVLPQLWLFGAWNSAFALGLGEIKITSPHNTGLEAAIPLYSAGKDAQPNVQVGTKADYKLMQAARPPFIDTLTFKVDDNPSRPGEKTITVTSANPISAPSFNLVIRVTAGSDSVLENYFLAADFRKKPVGEPPVPAQAPVEPAAKPVEPAPAPVEPVKVELTAPIAPPAPPADAEKPKAEQNRNDAGTNEIIKAADSGNPWVLQVAIHKNRKLAKRRIAKLKGIVAYESSSFTLGGAYIVLVGRFSTENEAGAYQKKLIELGEKESIAVKYPFSIKLAAFGNVDAALALRKKLKKAGHTPYILEKTSGENAAYTVYLGGFKQKNLAKKALAKLALAGIKPGIVAP